ncbi:MAG: copper resistance protein [Alphaproteobacteria bacterium]|nr:copper resistance protein [Alphaproteobacteria bacterium]
MPPGKIAQVLSIVFGLLIFSQSVQALDSNLATSEFGTARLVSAVTATGSLERIPLGLHLTLPEGWKTYWRSPGDAGLPARIDWNGSSNLADAEIRWPIPERFSLFGLETFGYEHDVVLPILARPTKPGEPMSLAANVDYLVCKDICVPITAALALELPAGTAKPSEFAHLIDRFNVRVPSAATAAGLTIASAVASGSGTAARLTVSTRSDIPFGKPDLLIEAPPGHAFGKPRVERYDGGHIARFVVPAFPPKDEALPGTTLTLTVTDGDRAAEVQVTPAAGAGGSVASELALALLAALIGGLILNLMPCVLPVLSIKLLSVVSHGGAERSATRRAFLASSAGILGSFALLASAAVAVKAAGATVGWGMQFQEPLFLVFMIVVVTLFAANLWGLFEVMLPAGLGTMLGSTPSQGLTGHFLTGALATLLATPCSAPFLGTAIAYALSRGAVEIYAIFAALGLGLALPYLAVAAFPGLATRLPRPGAWMATLRRVLALALAATALWLLWVLASSSGRTAALGVGAIMAAAVAALAFLPRARVAVAGLVIFAFVVPAALGTSAAPEKIEDATLWRSFDRQAIPRLVAEGKTVFVDVTADWCLTCQVNKRLVVGNDSVSARLKTPDVVALRADWTRPDPAIAEYLASHGRYGIPFNVVYGPSRPDGIVLPELLTVGSVLEALDEAKRR